MSANFALEWQPLANCCCQTLQTKKWVDRTLIHCTKAFLMREEYIVSLFSWTLDTNHQIQSQSHWQCTQLHKSRLSAETLKTVDLSKGWHWCKSHAVHLYHGHLTLCWRTQLPDGRNLLPAVHDILHTETGSQCHFYYEQPNHRSKNQIEQENCKASWFAMNESKSKRRRKG